MENNIDKSVFSSTFIPFVIKWGRGLNLLGVVLCFGPCLALALKGIFPPWDAFVAAFAIQFPLVLSPYIYEPISYFAVLGIPGTYMSFLSGNISNLRVPASSVAQGAAGVQEGSDEGTIIATIGIAISTFVNIVILSVGVFAGSYLLSVLPASVTAALNLLLPALFAALVANYTMQKVKLAFIGLPIAFVMVYITKAGMLTSLPGALASALPVLVSVFGTMGIGVYLAKQGKLD